MDRREFLASGAALPAAALGLRGNVGGLHYEVRHDQPRQTIKGLGFEIQNDSIGSDNRGLPDEVVAVPHDLVPAERERLYREMIAGFRYCRLALGLYLRGLNPEGTQIVARYESQLADLRELQQRGGFEGYAAEYWSPPPAWKSNGRYEGGTLKSYDPEFLEKFGDALVGDLAYLKRNGVKVVEWGLQNEPFVNGDRYTACGYFGYDYYRTFKAVAPKIRAFDPNLFIHTESGQFGQHDGGSAHIGGDPETLKFVDGWSYHRIGHDSNEQIELATFFNAKKRGKPVFNNEFEYLEGSASDERFVNTAQSIINWFVFCESPK